MKVLIIEDEKYLSKALKDMLESIDPTIEIVAQLETVKASVNFLKDSDVDLIFMDIHLGDGNSFQIFEQIDLKKPVVFTTAFDEYALQAFKTHSIDYLLKPIDEKQVRLALEKYKQIYAKEDIEQLISNKITEVMSMVQKKEYQTRFMVQMGSRIKTLSEDEVAYFLADGKIQMVVSKKDEKFFINQSLQDLEKKLDPANFFRLNRKFIVRIDAIDEIFTLSKSKLKVKLIPEYEKELDVVVSSEKSASFKKWISGE